MVFCTEEQVIKIGQMIAEVYFNDEIAYKWRSRALQNFNTRVYNNSEGNIDIRVCGPFLLVCYENSKPYHRRYAHCLLYVDYEFIDRTSTSILNQHIHDLIQYEMGANQKHSFYAELLSQLQSICPGFTYEFKKDLREDTYRTNYIEAIIYHLPTIVRPYKELIGWQNSTDAEDYYD